MDERTQEPFSDKFDDSGIRWAWVVIFVVTVLSNLMMERESFTYSLGHAVAGTTIGFVLSPIAFFVIKGFSKFRWMWYHWFNIATSIGFVADFLRWIIVPYAKSAIQ